MKVPCWVCKGSGILEDGDFIDVGCGGLMAQVSPTIYCNWCNETGMIEIGSEEHKKYLEAINPPEELH